MGWSWRSVPCSCCNFSMHRFGEKFNINFSGLHCLLCCWNLCCSFHFTGPAFWQETKTWLHLPSNLLLEIQKTPTESEKKGGWFDCGYRSGSIRWRCWNRWTSIPSLLQNMFGGSWFGYIENKIETIDSNAWTTDGQERHWIQQNISVFLRSAISGKVEYWHLKTWIVIILIFFQFLYDFEIRKISSLPNALIERWPQMKHDVLAAVDPSARDKILNMFNDDIGYFLALLKLLIPSNANLENVAGKLITFSNVSQHSIDPYKWSLKDTKTKYFFLYLQRMNDDPKNSMDKSNEYPNLVAMGMDKTDIRCFYIMFDQQQILVRKCKWNSFIFDWFNLLWIQFIQFIYLFISGAN